MIWQLRFSTKRPIPGFFVCASGGRSGYAQGYVLSNVQTPDSEEYPLTFRLSDRLFRKYTALDPSCGLLRKEMLYFFAALDEYLGYETPFHLGLGSWPKGAVKVKYATTVNPETFESYIMVDDGGRAAHSASSENAIQPLVTRLKTGLNCWAPV